MHLLPENNSVVVTNQHSKSYCVYGRFCQLCRKLKDLERLNMAFCHLIVTFAALSHHANTWVGRGERGSVIYDLLPCLNLFSSYCNSELS